MTFMCDSGVILWGEIRCWSFLGVKWLIWHDKGVPLSQVGHSGHSSSLILWPGLFSHDDNFHFFLMYC